MPEINAPLQFLEALDSLRGHTFRPEIHVVQIPPPKAIAPWAVALQAEINDSPFLDPDTYRGDARFVLLHDPQGQPAWEGQFRVVSYASSTLDPEIAYDPLLSQVAWAWLTDALHEYGAPFHKLTGSVTRRYNENFGAESAYASRAEVEVRASWTPDFPDVSDHLDAWADFVATICGLGPAGVASLPLRLQEMI